MHGYYSLCHVLRSFVLVTIAIGCTEDLPMPQNQEQSNFVTFEYYLDGSVLGDRIMEVIIYNHQGEIISDTILIAGSTYQLPLESDMDSYNLTTIRKAEDDGEEFLSARTFVNLDIKKFNINDQPSLDNIDKEYRIELKNTPGQQAYIKGEFFFGLINSEINGLTFVRDFRKWDDDALIMFQLENEEFFRYFWLENIECSYPDTLDLSNSKITESELTVNYPDNNFVLYIIAGKPTLQDTFYNFIDIGTSQSSPASTSHIVPDALFDYYYVRTDISTDEFRYIGIAETDKLEYDADIPAGIRLIRSSAISDKEYEFEVSGRFDEMINKFRYLEDSKQRLSWNIIQKGNEDQFFVLPEISDHLQIEIPNFEMSALQHHSTELLRYADPNINDFNFFVRWKLGEVDILEDFFIKEISDRFIYFHQ